jgi:hypothetical protein
MKLGTENRNKTIAAIVLGIAAVFLLVRMLQKPAPGAAATPTTSTARANAAGKPGQARPAAHNRRDKSLAAVLAPSLDPRLRLGLLKDSEAVKYEGTGRNVFSERLEDIPKPVASGLKDGQGAGPAVPINTGPPPPPPINLKLYGWASLAGEPKKIFLSQGGDVFVAGEGEIVARRYKVVKIGSNSVEIEDLLSNHRQSIPLT